LKQSRTPRERPASGGGSPGSASHATRVAVAASAVLAAVVCAAVITNYLVMPIIARRGDLVAAPDLVGRPLAEGQRVLAELGLNLRVADERPDPMYPGGRIVRQSMVAGSDVKRGRTMVVSVSSGLDLRTVPQLSGLPVRQAELEIVRAGLAFGGVTEVTSDRVDRGRVIGSAPGPGTSVPAGGEITVLVSLGRRRTEFAMPSLVGRDPVEATEIAEGLGLTVRTVSYGKSRRGAGLRETVILQNPPPGARVGEGDDVVLRVGRE